MRVCTQEIEIGPFQVDLTTGRLLREQVELTLRPQGCRVLKTLLPTHLEEFMAERELRVVGAGAGRLAVEVLVIGKVEVVGDATELPFDQRGRQAFNRLAECVTDGDAEKAALYLVVKVHSSHRLEPDRATWGPLG